MDRVAGSHVEALGSYWGKEWVAKSEEQVVAEYRRRVQAVLVARRALTGRRPARYRGVRDRPDTFTGRARDPLKGEPPRLGRSRYRVLGFHFHPIMGHCRTTRR